MSTRRWMAGLAVGCAAAGWSGVARAGGPDGPKVSPPAVEAGIEFRVMSVNTTTAVMFGEPGPDGAPRIEGQLQVAGRFSIVGAEAPAEPDGPKSAGGKPPGRKKVRGELPEVVVFPWRMVVTSAMDRAERELAEPARTDRKDQAWTRAAVANHFHQALAQPQGEHQLVHDWVRGLKTRPERVDRIRGRAEAMVGGRVVCKPIELKAMEEGVEVAPGVRLLITEVTVSDRRSVVDFEVRTRRIREGDKGVPGCEPVFVGLALRDDRGELVLLRNGNDVEARDEYLFLAREQMLPKDFLSRVKSAEAWVVDEVRPVSFEFEVSGLAGSGAGAGGE